MKIPKKQEIQQIVIVHSCGMDSKGLMKLYRKGNAEQYSVLAIDITFPSKNALNCQKNLLEKLYHIVMIIDEKITFQHDIKRVAAKISAL